MNPGSFIDRNLVLLDVVGDDLQAVLSAAAAALAQHEGLDQGLVERTLAVAAREGASVAVGSGVAIPHARIAIAGPRVVVVRMREPLPLKGSDGQPIDLFFVTLAPSDQPREHLLLLAHIARLVRSRILLDGLRTAETADDAFALIEAAEQLRHELSAVGAVAATPGVDEAVATPGADAAATPGADAATPGADAVTPGAAAAMPGARELVIIEMAGERAVDRLLVDLVDAGFSDAIAVDGQPVRDVVASELPLFAGFRDLFGDPAGTRVFLVTVPADRTEHLLELVRHSCEQNQCESTRVAVMPLRYHWRWQPPPPAKSSGGH